MDGVMAPRRRWMAWRLLDGNRARDSVIATAMVMDCDHNGDGQRCRATMKAMDSNGRSNGNLKAVDGLTAMDGSSMVMDGATQRQWMARRLLDGDGWCDGSLMAMYGEGQRKRNSDGLQLQW